MQKIECETCGGECKVNKPKKLVALFEVEFYAGHPMEIMQATSIIEAHVKKLKPVIRCKFKEFVECVHLNKKEQGELIQQFPER